eukprot:TRINITY_DN18567_c0_g1_i1.p1 TRINITY_DN18567_c0_g1~~TRINITY_DN18567_c0_g1_i1.p1  ORF type:complete len:327 (-),score=102.63 TRINITY_DN18567_c0_g1_i1:64-1017(-)
MVETTAATGGAAASKWASHQFMEGRKVIQSVDDVRAFARSKTHAQLMGFIRCLNDTVLRVPLTHDCAVGPASKAIMEQLDVLQRWVDEIPPIPGSSRFGNKAFRTWHERLTTRANEVHAAIVPESLRAAHVELIPYLLDSFGNPTRLDYGTGHELHFVAWLYCLSTLEVITPKEHMALVLRVFVKYLETVRKLQRVYRLEPAGSHGVWGLDDYQFMPFIWGSSQLVDHPDILPSSILLPSIVDKYAKDYLYIGCVKYINEVKKGPFHEHSPDLYNISAAVSWRKINIGMQKKYAVEVVQKFPVIQHFLFGTLLPWLS